MKSAYVGQIFRPPLPLLSRDRKRYKLQMKKDCARARSNMQCLRQGTILVEEACGALGPRGPRLLFS